MKSQSPSVLAYAAGFFDGEGCVTITKKHQLVAVVANTDQDIIDWWQSIFEGSYYTKVSKRPNHRPIYQWEARSRLADQCLKAILPWTRIKRDQIRLGIAFQARTILNRQGSRKVSEEMMQERESYRQRLAGMKRSEIVVS